MAYFPSSARAETHMAFGTTSHGSKTCVTEMKLGAIDSHGSWLAIILGNQHIEKKGNCHRALQHWKERGGERRREERKKGR